MIADLSILGARPRVRVLDIIWAWKIGTMDMNRA